MAPRLTRPDILNRSGCLDSAGSPFPGAAGLADTICLAGSQVSNVLLNLDFYGS
jgi:hypothetical protein